MSVDAIGIGDSSVNNLLNNVSNGVPNVTTIKEISNDTTSQNEVDERKIKDAITGANNKLVDKRTRCEYSYQADINRVSIKVYDCVTNEVIKEIPAEETLEAIRKIWELTGLLVDEKR